MLKQKQVGGRYGANSQLTMSDQELINEKVRDIVRQKQSKSQLRNQEKKTSALKNTQSSSAYKMTNKIVKNYEYGTGVS
jgi:hypothetical protein